MKRILLFVLLIIGFLLITPDTVKGQWPRVYGTTGDDAITKIMPLTGAGHYCLGYTQFAGSIRQASVTLLDSYGNLLWAAGLDVPSQWNDAIVTPQGYLLVVGNTLAPNNDNKSLLGLIDNYGKFIWVHSYDSPGMESFSQIRLNPVPQNSSFPYYITGYTAEAAGSSMNDVVLLTLDATGNTGWKKKYTSGNNDNFANDLEILPNGDLVMAGSIQSTGGSSSYAVIFSADNTGQMYNAAALDNLTSFTDVFKKSGGGFYAGSTEAGTSSQIFKFDSDFLPVWQASIPNIQNISAVWSAGSDVYVSAVRSISPVNQGVLLKFQDNGSTLTYQWTKYLRLDSSNMDQSGKSWFMPPNKVAYSDKRFKTLTGFGDWDAFAVVTDLSLNSCMTKSVSDNFQLKDNLFYSPIPLGFTVETVPVPTNVPNSTLFWSNAMVCTTEANCAFSNMHITESSGMAHNVVCGGAPINLDCPTGTGYTFSGTWGSDASIRAIMVNSCGTETANEFIIIHAGYKGFNVNDIKIDFDASANLAGPENNDINMGASPCGFLPGNTAMISGCPNVISALPGTVIPPNAFVIIQTSASAESGGIYDFSELCTYSLPVYVLRSSCQRSAEAFGNTGIGSVTTSVSITGFSIPGFTYNKTLLSNLNGDYFISPFIYGNVGCASPPASLVMPNYSYAFDWILTGPGGTQSGNYNYPNPYFSISLPPAYFSQPGLYTLTIQGHCGAFIIPCTIQFNVNCLNTGIELPALQEGMMRLYPNPTSGSFTLEMAQASASGTMIRIIKPTGQVVMERQVQAGECIHTFESGSMPAGLYFVQVLTNGRLVGLEKLVRQ